MSRWTTPGEAQAYETGYIEGKADAFVWIPTADRPPEFTKSYTDCESLRMEDGKIHAVNPFTVRTSDPVLAYGFCPETHERGVFQVQYEKWEFEDGRTDTSWCDIFTGDIEVVNVTAWMRLPIPQRGVFEG